MGSRERRKCCLGRQPGWQQELRQAKRQVIRGACGDHHGGCLSDPERRARVHSVLPTVDELSKQGPTGRNVRVAGTIVGESIVWDARDLRLTFDITDPGGVLNVVYHGPRPDMFRDGAEVVVEGKYAASGKLEARQLLLKCPSKYEEKQ